jgi:hypothetical protein
MKESLVQAIVAGAVFAAVSPAQLFTEPPPIIQLVRMSAANAASKPYEGTPLEVIGMNSVTGSPEFWLFEAHPSFASIEDLDRRTATLVPPEDSQTIIAVYREDWSYHPVDAARLFPRARYVRVSIHQLRTGVERDYSQLIQLRRQTEESMSLDRPEMVYQVISGAPVGTYLFVAPFVSLSKLDDGRPDVPVYAERLADARAEAKAKIAPDAEIARDNVFLRVDPSRSYVSEQFAAQDRTFWKGGQ